MLVLRNRIVGVFIAVVGLVFFAVGGYLIVSSTWHTTTATATACRANFTGTGSPRHVQNVCDVTWTDGGTRRTGSVTFSGSANVALGQPFPVHVNGDQVALPAPAWVRYGTLGLGAVLLAAGLRLALRRPRTTPV